MATNIAQGAGPTPPTAPFTQCPAIGADTSCGILIIVNPGGVLTILDDPSQPAYENSEDTLVGVQNNSGAPLAALPLSSGLDIFGFDADGICTVNPHPVGCPFGPTGYEGPNTSFTVADAFHGTVNFTGGLANGASAYFGLEEALTAQSFTPKPQFSGYSTGTDVFADLVKNLSPGVELANAHVAFLPPPTRRVSRRSTMRWITPSFRRTSRRRPGRPRSAPSTATAVGRDSKSVSERPCRTIRT